jgi:hypothetical protein
VLVAHPQLRRACPTFDGEQKSENDKGKVSSPNFLMMPVERYSQPLDIYVIPSGIDAFWFSFDNE